MRKVAFLSQAFADFHYWAHNDRKVLNRIVELIRDIDRSPFTGIGKPEPLKYQLHGSWSRRITDEHRLVYTVTDGEIVIVSCRFHYT